MWILVLLTFVNALVSHDLVLTYRLSVGGFPVSIFDVLLLGVAPVAVLVTRPYAYPTGRAHPVLSWVLMLSVAAVVVGLLAALFNGTGLRFSVTSLRNFISLPLCVWLGYCLLLQPLSAEKLCTAHVWVGVVTAAFVLLYFGRAASSFGPEGNIDTLRAMKYVAIYSGMAAVLLMYSLIGGVGWIRPSLALPLCGVCFIGQFATLSRSDWVAVWAAVMVVYLRLPSLYRGRKLAAAIVGPPVALAFLWVGLVVASSVTGTDFTQKMIARVNSLLPDDSPAARQKKAWDTRLSSTLVELKWWAGSPLFGRGFGIHETKRPTLTEKEANGLKHNTWVFTLAETGVVGFAAVALVVGGTYVVGRRMVCDRTDRGSVLVGALGVTTATIYVVLGLTTQSFNQVRGAMPLGVVCGVVLRCRAMQQAALRAQYEAQGYAPAGGDDGAGEYPGELAASYVEPDGVY
jgi:hypothetical protein